MSKHKPEPWIAHFHKYPQLMYARIEDVHGAGIAEVYTNKEAPQNAKRIVECVNACEGLSNDQIKRLPSIINEGTAAILKCNLLNAQIGEMLSALKDIENDDDSIPAPIWENIKNIIKKVEQ